MQGFSGCALLPGAALTGSGAGELHGWIMDRSHPERPSDIVCRGLRGKQRIFTPMTFRPDVVRATGVNGVFGFAIPMDLLAPLGPAITVTDGNNKVLANGRQVVLPPVVASTAADAPVNIFLHIPQDGRHRPCATRCCGRSRRARWRSSIRVSAPACRSTGSTRCRRISVSA